MYRFFTAHLYSTLGTMIVLCVGTYVLFSILNPKAPNWTTTTVTTGPVREIVSVSGVVDAKNTAELAFPSSGKVTEVFVTEGQQVQQGEVLATLASEQLVSQHESAQAELLLAKAKYEKLIAGESAQTRAVAETSVQNAQQKLERVRVEEKENVTHTRQELLSTSLEAHSQDINTQAKAPTISGSYTCDREGTYTITVYNSGAPSGYSYQFSGLETGTQAVSVNQPSTLGTCGLSIQFDQESHYSNTSWIITIPNTHSSTYLTNLNAYTQAQTQEQNAIAQAEDALTLAQKQAAEVIAPAEDTELAQAQAQIASAEAHIREIDALMGDRSIVAPFNGVVTDVSIVAGEVAPNTAVITLLASDSFELKARILERDITKVHEGQKVTAVFDANPKVTLSGKVQYVSPLAVAIDGVGYFEATIQLDTTPSWMKSGFNADLDIEIQAKENAVRIPTQYITTNSTGGTTVFTPNGSQKATTSITVITKGTDGFSEIEGLDEGQEIIAP